MKTRILWLITFLLYLCLVSGCSPTSRYERRLKHGMASGVRYDSLFMGIYLGMPKKDFYMHCWKLNRRGLIKQGSSNTTVEYLLKNELKHPALMDFYPTFTDEKISEMPVRFAYTGWAPWNKELSSENLQIDVLNWYKKVYGHGFIKVRHPKKGTAYLKVNGNRRILIFKRDDLYVWAVFSDMLINKDSLEFSTDFRNNIDTLLINDPELK
jgi:hypothetical protein